jgi:alpha-amylase/alpha-mannosidase (GH57 family)
MNNGKKLSLAIYWHMHQPVYELEGTYLLPWVRLHAVKDYLDMALYLEKFPKLKLNFNIVPALLDAIIDYGEKDYKDIHSVLTATDTDNLSDDEKSFIINNFFNAKFETMVYKNETFRNLYQKRFSKENFSINDFNSQEYADLMAVFNLVWIDPMHYERYPRLKELADKKNCYTLEDRIEILEIQKQIIREIIPTYKKYIREGRVELTTSPYYHTILPILIDVKSSAKTGLTTAGLPNSLGMLDDAKLQIKAGLDRIEDVFGIRPKGMWPPELCIGPKTLSLFAREGIKWTISDEGVLSNSINFDFIRDFKGNLSDPYHLLKIYQYKTRGANIDIVFRDRSIPHLINFEYAGINPDMAASDFYEKIKTIQNKLLVSPDNSHLLTIAADCENCWENYQNDGIEFLEKIYSQIENDESLETVLISDYIENEKHKKELKKIFSGSWIDKTFQYWIGEPEKNKAWLYLKNTKDALNNFIKHNKNHPAIPQATRELLISEGSDWFWWYGEPNNSGQDFLFDYMFRERLKHVYTTLGIDYPEYLNNTIITKIEVPFKYPKKNISPSMDGLNKSSDEWYNAGTISLLDGPVFRENKNVDKIDFGCDTDNIYFRLYVNKGAGDISFVERINQFYIYTRNASKVGNRAHIRLISRTDNPYPILTEKFEHELTLTLVKDTLYPLRLTTVIHPDIWTLDNPEGIKMTYEDVIDVLIPFEKLGIDKGETVEFFMANTDSAVKNTYLPQEVLLSMSRDY